MKHLTIEELQRWGLNGDQEALLELGRRALKYDFCEKGGWQKEFSFCNHLNELEELQSALNEEPPPDCPRCGFWLTDV